MKDHWTAGLVKVCGVTNEDDALLAVDAGADAIGVIFATSPREVHVHQVVGFLSTIGERALRVGVFRGRTDAEILDVLARVPVDAVQLHDELSDALAHNLHAKGYRIIKALHAGADATVFNDASVDAVLLDGPRPGAGQTHDFGVLGTRSFAVPVILAGGLDSDNVEDAVVTFRPWGVDAVSGTEALPGRKDAAKVASFVTNAHRAFASAKETR